MAEGFSTKGFSRTDLLIIMDWPVSEHIVCNTCGGPASVSNIAPPHQQWACIPCGIAPYSMRPGFRNKDKAAA